MLPFICSFQRVGTGQRVLSAAVVSQHKFASSHEPPPAIEGAMKSFFFLLLLWGLMLFDSDADQMRQVSF